MHRTDTVDVVFVLEGEVVLRLDGGGETVLRRGDVLVQNGARHEWANRASVPGVLAVFTVGADRP
jgi:quercetin dioxygenase-like cupin family protein